MANITGFGNTMSVGGPVLEPQLQMHPQQQQQQQHLMQPQQQQQQQQQMMYAGAAPPSNPAEIGKGAYVKILEQPAENKLRFRYRS